jgi:type I restriction enzyme S subunit
VTAFRRVPAKFLYQVIDNRAGNLAQTLPLLSVSISRGVIRRDEITEKEPRADDLHNYKQCSQRDIVINRMSAYQGALGISPTDGLVSPDYLVVRANDTAEPRFLTYLFRSTWFVGEMTAHLRGIGATDQGNVRTPRINESELGRIMVGIPTRTVQHTIADFLDREITRIDALIAAKRRMVELLVERVKVFTASRLLDLTSKTALLRQTANIYSGTGFPHEYQGHDQGDLPFYKVADLADSEDGRTICSADNWIDVPAAHELGCRPVPAHTILFPKVGAALLGNQRRITTVRAAFDNNLMAVVPSAHEPRFLRYYLSLVDLGEMANPGPVPSINEDVVASLRVPIPPYDIQTALADELDRTADNVTETIEKLTQQIGLSLEHRQALITSTVTGRLDIPEAA